MREFSSLDSLVSCFAKRWRYAAPDELKCSLDAPNLQIHTV
jgi:hypothetical protein